jgi:argininosuccinate synthase
MKNIRDAYDLSNHPKANEAINLMKTTKRCLEHQDMEQILRFKRVPPKESVGMKDFVFNRLQERGMYTNPDNLVLYRALENFEFNNAETPLIINP